MDSVQASNEPIKKREVIGRCEYQGCGKDAYYEIDFDCDDMTAYLCNEHHDVMLALCGQPYEDE